MATSIQELGFQMVLDTILTPAGVKVGGFPEEMFLDLSDEEQEKWACNICFLLVKDCHECRNKHLFCHACIIAWTMTTGQNSQRCPFCRCEQTEYASNKAVDRLIEDKRVTCPHENCTFTSPLKIFLLHSHGRMEYSNANVDLESLRSQHLVSPGLMTIDDFSLPSFARMQMLQGRIVAQQLLILLHLELRLRNQAVFLFTRAPDQESRAERFDEGIQLSEQLSEFGSVLSSVFASDLDGILAAPRRLPSVDSGLTRDAGSTPWPHRANTIQHQSLLASLADNDDSDTSSLSSDGSGVVSTARRDFVRQLESSATATASYASRSNWGPPPHRVSAAASVASSSSPRVTGQSTSFPSPSPRTLTHRLLQRPHDASRSFVTRESSIAAASSAVAQQPEHVTDHVTEHVTLPRVSPSLRLTGSGGRTSSVAALVAVRERVDLTAAVVPTAVASRTTAPSPPVSPMSSGSSLSLLDTSTASSVSSREASVVSTTTRQSSEPVGGRSVNTSFQPVVAATTPLTSQVTTSTTTRQTAHPATVATTRQSSQPTTDATARRAAKPAVGAAKRRTSQPSNGATTRQVSQASTVATARRNSQLTGARQPAPPRGSLAASRLVRQPGAPTRRTSQPTSTRQVAPPRGSVPASQTDVPARQLPQRRQTRSNVGNSTTGTQAAVPVTNARLPTTPGQLMRARRRSEISQEIADSLRKTHDHS